MGPLPERGAAEAIQPRLVRLHLHDNQFDPVGRGSDSAYPGDFDGRKATRRVDPCLDVRGPKPQGAGSCAKADSCDELATIHGGQGLMGLDK